MVLVGWVGCWCWCSVSFGDGWKSAGSNKPSRGKESLKKSTHYLLLKGYILCITKFIGSSPNFNNATPDIEIKN
jgi:hypothetical protein